MGRFTLALGYIITGDRRYLHAYNKSFGYSRPSFPQPPPSKEWLAIAKQLNDAQPVQNKTNDGGQNGG